MIRSEIYIWALLATVNQYTKTSYCIHPGPKLSQHLCPCSSSCTVHKANSMKSWFIINPSKNKTVHICTLFKISYQYERFMEKRQLRVTKWCLNNIFPKICMWKFHTIHKMLVELFRLLQHAKVTFQSESILSAVSFLTAPVYSFLLIVLQRRAVHSDSRTESQLCNREITDRWKKLLSGQIWCSHLDKKKTRR